LHSTDYRVHTLGAENSFCKHSRTRLQCKKTVFIVWPEKKNIDNSYVVLIEFLRLKILIGGNIDC